MSYSTILINILLGSLILSSCVNSSDTVDKPIPSSLAGQVYGWSNPPIDTTKCFETLPCNEEFPKLLFIDDSAFIKVLPAKCGDIGDCIRYYIGKYKIDEEALTLFFNPKMVVHHIKSINLASPYAEVENTELKKERLTRHNCADKLFFEECDVHGHFMTPKSNLLQNEMQHLKTENILDKLFEIK